MIIVVVLAQASVPTIGCGSIVRMGKKKPAKTPAKPKRPSGHAKLLAKASAQAASAGDDKDVVWKALLANRNAGRREEYARVAGDLNAGRREKYARVAGAKKLHIKKTIANVESTDAGLASLDVAVAAHRRAGHALCAFRRGPSPFLLHTVVCNRCRGSIAVGCCVDDRSESSDGVSEEWSVVDSSGEDWTFQDAPTDSDDDAVPLCQTLLPEDTSTVGEVPLRQVPLRLRVAHKVHNMTKFASSDEEEIYSRGAEDNERLEEKLFWDAPPDSFDKAFIDDREELTEGTDDDSTRLSEDDCLQTVSVFAATPAPSMKHPVGMESVCTDSIEVPCPNNIRAKLSDSVQMASVPVRVHDSELSD